MCLYDDLVFAVEHAKDQCHVWQKNSKITHVELESITLYLNQLLESVTPESDCSTLIEPPVDYPLHQMKFERHIRFLKFLNQQLNEIQNRNIISQETLEVLKSQVEKRIITYELQLKNPNSLSEEFVNEVSEHKKIKAAIHLEPKPKRNLIERILDPQSLQTMMMGGAGLIVIGLIIWLYTIGLFDNPLIVAMGLGAGNLALISAGMYMVKSSRYKLAGQGLALLGSLLLPLNLWFYDAQGLITLNNGGHLWIPAFVICFIYAAIAMLLVDSLFVYAFVAGIGLTGLLILGDQKVAHFYEIIAPSTLLVIWGTICIHAERLFPRAGKLNRDDFGKAFFNAGHITMAAGLIILLTGRLIGHFYNHIYTEWVWFTIPDVVTNQQVQLIAIGLTMAATWSYIYSWLSNNRTSKYAYSAVLTLVWSAVILLDILAIPVTETLFLFILTISALAIQLLELPARQTSEEPQPKNRFLNIPNGVYGDLLTVATLMLAISEFARNLIKFIPRELTYTITPFHVTSMGLLTLTGIIGIIQHHRAGRYSNSLIMQNVTGASLIIFTLQLFLVLGLSWSTALFFSASLILVSLLSPLFKVENGKLNLVHSFEFPAIILMLCGVADAIFLINRDLYPQLSPLNLSLFSTELAVIFGILTYRMKNQTYSFLTAFCSWIAVVNMMYHFNFITYAPVLAGSMLGLLALTWDFVSRMLSAPETDNNEQATSMLNKSGIVLLSMGSVAGLLLTLNRLAGGGVTWELFNLVFGQTLVTLLAAFIQHESNSKRSMFVFSATHFISAILVINALSVLTLFQKFEIITTTLGIIMLIAGHIGWRTEDENDDDESSVSFNLTFGSILAAVPLLLGMINQRMIGIDDMAWGWIMAHELGVLIIGLTLFGLGILCRIRSTTIMGLANLTIYIASLLFLIHLPEKLQTVAVYLMLGGGSFFSIAILLSIYRERLLTLPSRIRNREGIYQVLRWR